MKIKKVKVKETNRKTSRVFFFVDNETVFENLLNRRQRPYDAYRTLLPGVFKKAKIDPVKASWRQNAGCSCGCSPAFVLDDDNGLDIFVDIKA